MKKLWHQFASAFTLVSRLPLPLSGEPDYSRLSLFLPLVGLPAGLCLLAGGWLGRLLFGPGALAALLALLGQYLAFNLFHLDGWLDTADAAGVFGDAEKKKAVLKDPRIGVFAFFAGFVLLSGRLAGLAELLEAADWRWFALAALVVPATGRLAGVIMAASQQAASQTGLAALAGPFSAVQGAIGFCLAGSPAFLLLALWQGILAAIALYLVAGLLAALAGLLVGLWYKRHIGGYTGDAIGTAIELGELLGLLVLAAMLR
jgi:adenosylcobinamide-GDP ribazoletransferase